MRIVIVGTGYVGLVTGTCLAEGGNDVVCVDVDRAKIDVLERGGLPIYEPGLEELVRRNVKERRLSFTTSIERAMDGADVAFIAVGTPPGENGEADLTYVLEAARGIGRAMTGYAVVVNKSTVPVGSAERVAAVLAEEARHPFDVVSNPEFLKEGSAVDDFMRPDRVVIGATSEKARATMADLYAPFVRTENPILYMDPRSAELTKYAANAMLATRISFMNDIAALCERLGADVDQVRRGMGGDRRIGYSFLFPGVGFGGSCLAGDETVLVRRHGRVRLLALRECFDDAAAGGAPEVAPFAAVPSGLEVLAWRPEGSAPEFLSVAAVTRRPYEGQILDVRTKMGRRVRCTPDHPLVVTNAAGSPLTVKRAEDLDANDWLPVVQGAPPESPAQAIDVAGVIDASGIPARKVRVRLAPTELERLRAMDHREVAARLAPLSGPRDPGSRAWDLVRTGTLRLDEVRALGLSSDGAMLGTAKNGTYLPARIPMDATFWRVIGLYLAEGHVSADGARRRAYWSFHPHDEEDLVDEVADYWRRLGVKVDVRRGSTTRSVSVSSRILASLLLDRLQLGSNCYGHRIPDEAYSSSEPHKRALMAGLWQGDGSCSFVNHGPSVVLEYGTVSRRLADGMLRLLGDLGVVARLKTGRTAKSTVLTYWLVISGAAQVERLLELVPERARARVRDSLMRQRKRIAPTGSRRFSQNAAFVRVTRVERRPFRDHVYSLEVPDAHTFVTTAGLVVHNCFPKDVRALMTMARQVGLDFDILRGVERVNERQKRSLVEKAQRHFGANLAGRTFGVWGLAFKPKTDDIREAPSLAVIEGLVGAGASVKAYDPVAAEVFRRHCGDRVHLTEEPYAAAEGADGLVLVTEWNEFRHPDFTRLKRILKEPVLFDGRNVWDPRRLREQGFVYYGIGRGARDA